MFARCALKPYPYQKALHAADSAYHAAHPATSWGDSCLTGTAGVSMYCPRGAVTCTGAPGAPDAPLARRTPGSPA
eukprot:9125086-Pyramimonas_sp.AAC.1